MRTDRKIRKTRPRNGGVPAEYRVLVDGEMINGQIVEYNPPKAFAAYVLAMPVGSFDTIEEAAEKLYERWEAHRNDSDEVQKLRAQYASLQFNDSYGTAHQLGVISDKLRALGSTVL